MSNDKLNLDIESIFAVKPEYQSNVFSWHGHIPFAFALINELKPRLLVELGTHKGDSYLSFCQAVRKYKIDTKCFAIDTWRGDEQAGYYEDDVYESLKAIHDPLNGEFSSLIRTTFDEALKQFKTSSIDLLHIDGRHTYEAVKHDYTSWLPKLSDRGIILLHDIGEKSNNFGVWKLWDEISPKYPHFSFSHSHGLGVLSVGSNVPDNIIALCNLNEAAAKGVENIFETVGKSVAYDNLMNLFEELSQLLAERDEAINGLHAQLTEREAGVVHLQNSIKEKDDHIQQTDAELAGLREEFVASQQSVKEHETKVAQLQAEIKERDEHVQRLESDSAGLQEQCTAFQGTIIERDAEVVHLQGRIKEKDDHIQQTDAELAGLREEFVASQQSVKEHETKVAQLQAEIKERDEHVQRLESDSAGLQEQCTAFQGTIIERDAEVVHLQNSIKEKDDHIQQIDSELTGIRKELTASQQSVKENESKVSHLEAEIKGKDVRIHQLDADVGRFRDEADSLRTHVENYRLERESIFDSTSWKLIAPLRWMSVKARCLKRNLEATRYLFSKQYRLIKKSGLFDMSYYLDQNPDVAESKMNPLLHYLKFGAREGRNPNSIFLTLFYLGQNPDVAESKMNPLMHYLLYGRHEGRCCYLSAIEGEIVHGLENSNESVELRLEQQRQTQFSCQPKISIITPIYNTPERLLIKMFESVLAQTYANWELCAVNDGSTQECVRKTLEIFAAQDERIQVKHLEQNLGITEATNESVRISTGEFLAFVDHDDELTPDALFEVVELLNKHPDVDVIYTDQDKMTEEGHVFEPFFKPDWSPEFFRGVMYVGHLLVSRKRLVEKIGLLHKEFDFIQDYDMMLRLSEHTTRIHHIPKILYHWRQVEGSTAADPNAKADLGLIQLKAVNTHLQRMNMPGYAEKGNFPHRVQIFPLNKESYPLVSIIIPTKDQCELLNQCLHSIFTKTTYPHFEVILMDNNTTEQKALKCMEAYPVERIPFTDRFNFSAANNLGVQNAKGEFIIFLNNDTEVVTEAWIQHLLYYAEQDDIGAVGPLLLFPNGRVQHAGVVLGFRGTTDHVMRDYPADCDGYFGTLSCAREVSAVTAACMMLKSSLFLEIGGFNAHYASIYQDLDFCLRLRTQGYRLIYTPTAVLKHYESSSRGHDYDFVDRVLLLDQWQDIIEAGDPYYNPNFDVTRYGDGKTGYTLKRNGGYTSC